MFVWMFLVEGIEGIIQISRPMICMPNNYCEQIVVANRHLTP